MTEKAGRRTGMRCFFSLPMSSISLFLLRLDVLCLYRSFPPSLRMRSRQTWISTARWTWFLIGPACSKKKTGRKPAQNSLVGDGQENRKLDNSFSLCDLQEIDMLNVTYPKSERCEWWGAVLRLNCPLHLSQESVYEIQPSLDSLLLLLIIFWQYCDFARFKKFKTCC